MKIVKLVLALLAAIIVVGGAYIAYTIHLQTKQQEQETAAENEIINREFKPVVESYIEAFNRCEIVRPRRLSSKSHLQILYLIHRVGVQSIKSCLFYA